VAPVTRSSLTAAASGDGQVYQYQYEITWGPSNAERCSEMRFLVFNADAGGTQLELDNMSTYIPGYGENSPSNTKTCEPGGLCTVFSSRGYSNSCNAKLYTGTIQRDILLEF